MMGYLNFEPIQLKAKKTLDVFVKSQGGTILGTIKWYPHWRRYVFHPTLLVGTSFDSNCLKELTDYLDHLMVEWLSQCGL